MRAKEREEVQRFFRLLLRLFPMFVVMGTIFFLSGIPGNRLLLPNIEGIDKIAHITAYGILAITVFHAFGPRIRRLNPRWLTAIVILICVSYGITDEYHQSFIPGRTASLFDLLADGFGTIIVCIIRNSKFWRELSL
jgi:VanZ like family